MVSIQYVNIGKPNIFVLEMCEGTTSLLKFI